MAGRKCPWRRRLRWCWTSGGHRGWDCAHRRRPHRPADARLDGGGGGADEAAALDGVAAVDVVVAVAVDGDGAGGGAVDGADDGECDADGASDDRLAVADGSVFGAGKICLCSVGGGGKGGQN